MGKLGCDRGESSASDMSSAGSACDYAPSPNTCSQALTRANQLRVQALLRQLLSAGSGQEQSASRRLDTLRVLRRTMRELDHHLSWLTQVDFFETIELILRDERHEDEDGRLVHDATQLLIESIPRASFDLEPQTVRQIFASVVQNLGHQRSEVRRASLLLINMYLNERPAHFQLLLKLFIDYGLSNHRNKQAQRGAILSLPLLMTEQTVGDEDLLPLVKCLSDLLLDANPQLFYSLYLALQRLHLTVGDQQFAAYLRQCNPEATLLYKQATSRHTSFDQPAGGQSPQETQAPKESVNVKSSDDNRYNQQCRQQADEGSKFTSEQMKQVTFEADLAKQKQQRPESEAESDSTTFADASLVESFADNRDELLQTAPNQQRISAGRDEPEVAASISSLEDSEQTGDLGCKRRSLSQSTSGPVRPRSPRAQSSVSSTCSSEANLVDPAHYMNAAALSGRPLTDFEQIHHLDHSATGLAINDLCVSCTPTRELGPGAEHELKFGIFPRHLIAGALNLRHSDRLEALEELMCIVRDSPINRLAILMTYFDSFLEQFLTRLLDTSSADYRVGLIAIDMIETIVIKTKVSTMQYVRPIVGLLIKSLADAGRQSVFRENSVRVIHKMMAFLPPQYVIDAIFEHKHNRSALVREESANRVTAAVLHYDKNEFNLTKLCYHVLPMLADHQANVRLAALECIASLAHALGPDRIGSLLTAAEAVQTGCDYDGLLDAIHARIMRRALPRVNPDGSVRYVIKPFLNSANANFHQEHQAADVRWVLEAPSRHQHPHQQSHNALASVTQGAEDYPAERPGHYAPQVNPTQRRRSVANLMGVRAASDESPDERHHRHHHPSHHHAQEQEQQLSGSPTSNRNEAQAAHLATSGGADCGLRREQDETESDQAREKPTKQSPTIVCGTGSEIERKQCARQSESTRSSKLLEQNDPAADQRRDMQAASKRRMRRSNSQSSASSTDTNKVLFQYYLGKFKQSLSESSPNGIMYSAALPSDSIIYTDVVQAYELSRHQSRYQQTSFDYEPGLVGRVPYDDPMKISSEELDNQQQNQRRIQNRKQSHVSVNSRSQVSAKEDLRSAAASDTSASESPETVMESSARRQETSKNAAENVMQRSDDQGEKSAREKNMTRTESQESSSGSRRKSVARQSQDSDVRRKSSGASSGGQNNQKSLSRQSSRKSSVAPQRGSVDRDDLAEIDKQQEQVQSTKSGEDATQDSSESRARRKASLARQSGSTVAATTAESSDAAWAADTTPVDGTTNGPSVYDNSSEYRLAEETSGFRQQESLTTSDSQSRDLSDHATQTTPQPSDRQSRRRRSSKRSLTSEQDAPVAAEGNESNQRTFAADEDEPLNSAEVRRRASRSQPPAATTTATTTKSGGHQHKIHKTPSKSHLLDQQRDKAAAMDAHRSVSVSPSVATSVNIRHILENVAENEGPFQEPQLAYRVAMEALTGSCWSTKVEGILALIRLSAHHRSLISVHLHEVVNRIAIETRNLRSTVARSAIFALGDLCARLGRAVEPEMDTIVQALLNKSMENTAFIRDDIRQALSCLVDHLTQWRLATSLISQGANHKNMHVRRMASQFIALLVGRMGAAKCLVGARDISAQLLPAAAKFAQDGSPHTRYYGRLILSRIMQHSAFDRLLRKNLAPNLYRSTIGIIESVKRRGAGEPPIDA